MKSDIQLSAEAIKVRGMLGYDNRQPIAITNAILNCPEYTLIRMAFTTDISGMSIMEAGSKIIAVNTAMSLGRQRFSAAHELYHVEVEKSSAGTICKSGYDDKKSDSEMEADKFASYFLMPYDGMEWYIGQHHIEQWNKEQIFGLSQYYRMSFMAVIVRLYQEKRITRSEYELLKYVDVQKEAMTISVAEPELYQPNESFRQYRVDGQYIQLMELLKPTGAISESRYGQFAREAFMDDRLKILEKGVMYND
ncbi:MAG: ImmA/IrrE family metallo-endopeptidase [Roseburia sp.]|nr:ImmA/IrrE family metallo-endopeptidase [Roseburia sp.]